MQTVSRIKFTTVKTEGAILPADLLQRVADGRDLEGQAPTDYHLAPNERLNEAVNRAWNRCLGVWQSFNEQRQRLPASDAGTTLTRERWLLILFQELGYGRLQYQGSLPLHTTGHDSRSTSHDSRFTSYDLRYPISHQWSHAPIHLITFRQDLDRRDPSSKRSPHSLLQEFLNRSDESLWGLLSNGLRLRVLRDNVSLTRAAYVEFDLEAMMNGELYADFSLLWLVCHQSRVEGTPPGECWLERWSQEAAAQGTRALDALRDGVKEAIAALGRGFLAHPANRDLKTTLKSGELNVQDFYRQLLRLVYRLIFLFVAEDRDLLLLPGTPAEAQRRYAGFYSVRRLRDLAEVQRGGPHPDLYRCLRQVFVLLRQGYEPLGLPGLGSFLFSERSTPALDGADIANRDLLDAVRALAFTVEGRVRRPVDYKNLGSEELGSVYESLLELHPQLNADAGTFALGVAAGSERKTTGSYYTPSSLIRCLLDSALEPVVEDRLTVARNTEHATRDTLEKTILNIKVVDPACGSGHFLIAAAHRLARHLARARTGDDEPAPTELRAALRDVVRRCIHGVDINPMAVELCKVALWMETLDPGKPLSFLDRNIQCGNSLIGTTPALLEKGIPNEAFKPITGDDRAYCSEWRKRNKKERGQPSLFTYESQPWDRLGNLAAGMMSLDAVGDDTLDDVHRQQQMYESLVRSADYRYGQLWADAWCAAFVWRKTKEFAYPITEEVFRRIERNPFDIPKWMEQEIERLRERYQFFHWHLAFPHVFSLPPAGEGAENEQTGWNGGFDVVLGNPPWEMVELSEREFFASKAPDIANAPTARRRRQMITALEKEDHGLYTAFVETKHAVYAYRKFVQNSGRFPYSAVGRINLYPLFVEASAAILSSEGYTGVIVPSAISMDAYNVPLFKWLVSSQRFISLFDFENRGVFFAQVHRSYRFCLLTLCGADIQPTQLNFFYFGGDVAELKDENRRITLTSSEIDMFSPNTFSPPILLNSTDERLAKAVYKHFGVLVNRKSKHNPWKVSVQRMLSLSDPGDLFRKITELTEQDVDDENQTWVRLYSGKTIYQFDHRFATYGGKGWREFSLEEYTDPYATVKTEYYARKSAVDNRLEDKQPNSWLMVYRDITRATDKRSAVAAILPCVGCDTTCRNIYSDHSPQGLLGCLLSNLNSFALNYFARQKIIGIHLNAGILEQLPILPPEIYDHDCLWPVDNLISSWIIPRVLELTYTAWDLQPFAHDCGYDGPPFRWDEARRFTLRCELDAVYFHLYSIARDDVDYIMDTFPIVKRKDEKAHGEYRTKRVILEIYDEMQRAIETGQPYQTLLDPPPADPRVAHEPKKTEA